MTRLATALEVPWTVGGLYLEGLRWLLERAAALPATTPSTRAAALATRARLSLERGDLDAARAPAAAASELARAAGDEQAEVAALLALAGIAYYSGEFDRMRTLFDAAEPLLRRTGDSWHLAFACFARGSAALAEGRYDDAERQSAEAISAYVLMEDVWGLAGAEANLAAVHLARGDFDKAREAAERAVRRFEAIGDRSWLAHALAVLGAALMPVDPKRARGLLLRAGDLALRSDEPVFLPSTLTTLGDWAAGEGRPDVAARLVHAGRAVADRLGIPEGAPEREARSRLESRLRAAPGGTFDELAAEGARLDPRTALDLARGAPR